MQYGIKVKVIVISKIGTMLGAVVFDIAQIIRKYQKEKKIVWELFFVFINLRTLDINLKLNLLASIKIIFEL